MSYQGIARKYRPQTFTEITGQKVPVRTLQNAIRRNRTAHAYLFSGPRGVGKTTMARVLAKALNCLQGPTPEPCCECVACLEIAQGNSLDVLEIDAASNRGIDEIRELRESIQYGPARDRFKIFIIDEAHMLTHEAFNALLKTLEEPPAHVVFMLATTEKQKIPGTILSRCQPFDFQLIATTEIVDRIKVIAEGEKLSATDRVIEQIAVAGEGSLRDALSLLDQVINYCGQKLNEEDVSTILGEVDFSFLERTSQAVLQGRTQEILQVVADVSETGHDLQHFCRRLQQHFRNLLVSNAGGPQKALLNLPESQGPRLAELSKAFSQEDLVQGLEILAKAETEMRWAYYPRINLELALLKLSYLPRLQPLRQFISELKSQPSRDLRSPHDTGVESMSSHASSPGSQATQSSRRPPASTTTEGTDPRMIQFRKRIREEKPLLESWLETAESIEFSDDELKILFSSKYVIQHEKLSETENRNFLTRICHALFGEAARLNLILEGGADRKSATARPRQVSHQNRDVLLEEPIMKSFLEAFPGDVSIEEKEP